VPSVPEWYYTLDGQRRGPVSTEELKDLAASGVLNPTELVWKEGMADWSEAGATGGLFADGAAAPARLPKKRERSAEDHDDYADDDYYDRPRGPKAKALSTGTWVAIIGGVVGALVVLGVVVLVIVLNSGGSSKLDQRDELTRADPVDNVQQGCHRKVYTVRLDAGKTYTIDMMGGRGGPWGAGPMGFFDPFLRLEDASTGMQVAANDDIEMGIILDARIIYRVTRTGDYRVIATTCDPGQVGRFRLTVREGAHHQSPPGGV
jgi:hypothetical protein